MQADVKVYQGQGKMSERIYLLHREPWYGLMNEVKDSDLKFYNLIKSTRKAKEIKSNRKENRYVDTKPRTVSENI